MSRLRWLPVLALFAALGTTLPARADSSTLTFRDPSGDWQVPSQDVVTVTLRSVSSQAKHWLEADITLAAPVGPTYTTYTVAFQIGSSCYALATSTVNGGPLQQSAGGASVSPSSFSEVPCTDPGVQPTGAPAASMARGSTVQIRAPYALGLRRGMRVTAVGFAVGTQPIESWVGLGAKSVSPTIGDFGATDKTLTLR